MGILSFIRKRNKNTKKFKPTPSNRKINGSFCICCGEWFIPKNDFSSILCEKCRYGIVFEVHKDE